MVWDATLTFGFFFLHEAVQRRLNLKVRYFNSRWVSQGSEDEQCFEYHCKDEAKQIAITEQNQRDAVLRDMAEPVPDPLEQPNGLNEVPPNVGPMPRMRGGFHRPPRRQNNNQNVVPNDEQKERAKQNVLDVYRKNKEAEFDNWGEFDYFVTNW